MIKVWVLTREINEYDQDGEYFEAVWLNKPTVESIIKYLNCDNSLATHICNGGGRINIENTWYHLKEIEVKD